MTLNTSAREPWLRGTRKEVPAVHRAVLHALELAEEDITRWCGDFTAEELNEGPAGVASVGFHLRHIAGSVDRLLTYAEGHWMRNKWPSLKARWQRVHQLRRNWRSYGWRWKKRQGECGRWSEKT